MRSGGDLAAALDRHALPRDRLLGHHEGGELPPGALLLDAAQLIDTGELLLERAHPPESGRDRVGFLGDVVAVQRVTDLEPQRVARAEAARDDVALGDRVPERARVLGHAEVLAAVLP